MSKKRNTRKQKEKAATRQNIEAVHIHQSSPTYSIAHITSRAEVKAPLTKASGPIAFNQKDNEYLRHDMVAISAATGIVVVFDVLLLVLLTSGGIRLNFLGY